MFRIACLTASLVTTASAAPQKPFKNVVLFVVDDQGFQAGCYGNKVIKTPGIDALAKAGVRFTRAQCTTASCSASRSVLLTGLYNHATGHYGHSHGYNHMSTYESVKTLPVMLGRAGYRTCSVGKYHVAPKYIYKFQDYRNKGVQGNRNAVQMAKNAAAWIREDKTKPFFLYFCTSDPHRGGGADGFSNFNDDPSRYPGVKRITYDPKDVIVPPWLPDTPACRKELAEYYQAISRLDQGMGELLKTLKETGNWENTLILFLSDNGPPFPGAKTTLYQPGMNLPLIVRKPGSKRQGKTCDALVTWADITPTILDWCGVTPKPAPPIRPTENDGDADDLKQPRGAKNRLRPWKFHGRSFLAAMEERKPKAWDENFASHTFHEITMYYPMRVVISGKYKLIFNIAHQLPYPFASDLQRSPTWQSILKTKSKYYGRRKIANYLQRPRFELYDLEKDPHEINNLAGNSEFSKITEKLKTKLRAWQKQTRDPWVLKWDYE